MIGVDGQYIFKFSIGNNFDFIDNNSLNSFFISEESGNALPTWSINFDTEDVNILALLNEGNDFKIAFGTDSNNMQEVSLATTKKTYETAGNNRLQISALGVIASLSYITIANKQITDKKSSIEVIKEIANKHFRVDTNINSSNDSQNWIQPNITDKAFIDQLALHTYLDDSFLATAICYDNTFRIRDIKKTAIEKYKYKFTNNVKQSNDIYRTGISEFVSESGFINCWVGYGREKLIHSLEEGTTDKVIEDITPLIALTKKLTRRADIEKRSAVSGIHNENTHSKYHQAALRNIMGLAVFSSERNRISFDNQLINIHPLDLVMFKQAEINSNQSSEFESGLYFVGAIGRSLSNSTLTTTIDLYRESSNAIRGDLK